MLKKIVLNDPKYLLKIKERLKNNIEMDQNNCWNWKKKKMISGYGTTTFYAKWITTHRLSYLVFKGDIPKDKIVCHSCDNPSCCNPDHLWLGTHKENTRDMMNKKVVFQFKGENNNMAVLNESIVLEMRSLNKQGLSVKKISEIYGFKYFTCLDAVSGRNWKHI